MKLPNPSRRSVIRSLASASMLLPGMLSEMMAEPTGDPQNPLAPRAPHFPGKAKRVIFLYMTGGVSHMDSFDPKPKLFAARDRPKDSKPKYLPPLWEFKPGGKCGTEVSELRQRAWTRSLRFDQDRSWSQLVRGAVS